MGGGRTEGEDAERRLWEVLLGYLRAAPGWTWPGVDGLTVADLVGCYPEAVAVGEVPDWQQLLLSSQSPRIACMRDVFFDPAYFSGAEDEARADILREGYHPVPYTHPRAEAIPSHRHPVDQTLYMLKGAMDITIGGETYPVRMGSKLVIPMCVWHEVNVRQDGTTYLMGWSKPISWEEFDNPDSCP